MRISNTAREKTHSGKAANGWGSTDHEDEIILKAQNFIEQHYLDKLTVVQVADHFFVTRRNFERRFKKRPGIPSLNIYSV